jgi:hypothetical protein
MYSGTLGMKHDPGLLLRVAEALEDVPATLIVVFARSREPIG